MMAGLEFAKNQLKKHGWTEGAGLGKLEDGRSQPIKVSLKMDKTGVGHDPGKEFTDHWWLRVFNEAAQKIGSNKQNESSTSHGDGKSRKKRMAEGKKNLYKGFVKSSTLTNGVEEKDESPDSDTEDECHEDKNTSLPTLDDIHKFCGGATGHRAARFGIKMKGKLARVAHHDKLFEERLGKMESSPQGSNVMEADPHTHVNGDGNIELKLNVDDASLNTCSCQEDRRHKKSKKKKKRKKEELCSDDRSEDISKGPARNVTTQIELDGVLVGRADKVHKKRRKEERSILTNDFISDHSTDATAGVAETSRDGKRTKAGKRKKEIISELDPSETVDDDPKRHKRKKRKREKEFSREEVKVPVEVLEESDVKKKRKKKKKD